MPCDQKDRLELKHIQWIWQSVWIVGSRHGPGSIPPWSIRQMLTHVWCPNPNTLVWFSVAVWESFSEYESVCEGARTFCEWVLFSDLVAVVMINFPLPCCAANEYTYVHVCFCLFVSLCDSSSTQGNKSRGILSLKLLFLLSRHWQFKPTVVWLQGVQCVSK